MTDAPPAAADAALPSLSVAMATYNGARFLREQLDSIAAQTLLPAELVVSDDGSSDATLGVIAEFAATAPFPVRVLAKEARLGFADNFLHAAEHCRGDLVAFADQDDRWLPQKLAVGAARLLADDSLLSMHRLTLTDERLVPTGIYDQGIAGDAVWQPLALDPYATGWGNTMLFHRELALLVPRAARPRQPEADRPLSHDTWLYVLAAALGRVSHIAEPLILYRQHAGNAMGTVAPGRLARLRAGTDTFRTVPITVYRERIRVNETLTPLLDDLAERLPRWSRSATRAAVRLGERTAELRRRVALYEASSITDRLRAFRSLADGRRRGLSLAKDATLGLTGWGRLC